jgi:hypothetical protein
VNKNESEENRDKLQCPNGDCSDADYDQDEEAASRSQYYGRWAAERWILRRYLRRFVRFSLSQFKPAKSVKSSSDELRF